MSISIRKFLKEEVWNWLCGNTSAEINQPSVEDNKFWIRAGEPSAETDSEEKAELDHFKAIRNLTSSKTSGLSLIRYTNQDESFILIMATNELREAIEFQPDYGAKEAPLLLTLLYCVRTATRASSSIPGRSLIEWAQEGALADDIRPYLPPVLMIKLSGERTNYQANLLSTLLSCEIATRPSSDLSWLREELCGLVLRVPESEHDWLFDELSNAANATHLDYTFLLIYRVFEFFFPMSGIHHLRDSAKIVDSHLDLLHKCQTNLKWFWKHDASAKTVARFAKTDRFVEPLRSAGLVGHNSDVEDAGSKLVSIRNDLAHQAYRKSFIDSSNIKAAVLSCTMLCADAFEIYNEWRVSRTQPHI